MGVSQVQPLLVRGAKAPPESRTSKFIVHLNHYKMVTVVDVAERQNKEGKPFTALVLMGGIEMVKSQTSGRYYATARKTSMPSTFPLEFAKSLIGQQIPGSICRMTVDPYPYTLQETGEVIQLSHCWVYVPEGEQAPSTVPEYAMVH